jgi:hypothetical protein
LNAEGAKVSQRAQKRNTKNKTKKENAIFIFNKIYVFFFIPLRFSFSPFCVLCETFAPSAFKKIRFRPQPTLTHLPGAQHVI